MKNTEDYLYKTRLSPAMELSTVMMPKQ